MDGGGAFKSALIHVDALFCCNRQSLENPMLKVKLQFGYSQSHDYVYMYTHTTAFDVEQLIIYETVKDMRC